METEETETNGGEDKYKREKNENIPKSDETKSPLKPKETPARVWRWFNESNFERSELIGRGSFGEVWKIKFKDSKSLKDSKKPPHFGGKKAAVKYLQGPYLKQLKNLSHEISCNLILHLNLGN